MDAKGNLANKGLDTTMGSCGRTWRLRSNGIR